MQLSGDNAENLLEGIAEKKNSFLLKERLGHSLNEKEFAIF